MKSQRNYIFLLEYTDQAGNKAYKTVQDDSLGCGLDELSHGLSYIADTSKPITIKVLPQEISVQGVPSVYAL
jgi:hypothetical protein